MAVDTIKTGIPGLDKILNGGLRKNSNLLVTGAPGTGKTLMALQFVYHGAKNYGDKGIYISTEESIEDLKDYSKNLGIDLGKYEKEGKIFLYPLDPLMLKGGIASIKGLLNVIRKKGIKRFALDSLILFRYLYPNHDHDTSMEFRRHILIFLKSIKAAGVTSLIVSERKSTDMDKLHFSEIDFVFDGFMILSRVRKGSYFERVATIVKIRGQNHSMDIYPISIGKGGAKILAEQTPYSLVEKESGKFR